MRLENEFFHSKMWLDGRCFSRQEAWLDLVGCYEANDLSKGEEGDFFPTRWSWSAEEVETFIKQVMNLGWWNSRRCAPSATSIGIKREELPANELIQSLHKLYNQQFGRRLKLTPGRKKAYQRLCDAGLDADKGAFIQVCDTIKRSGWHMSKLTYQDPISLFRTSERCETWILSSLQGDDPVTDEQLRERSRYIDGVQAVEEAEEPQVCDASLKQLYLGLTVEHQNSLREEYQLERDHWVRRIKVGALAGSISDDVIESYEQALWRKLVANATGYVAR